MSATGLEVFDKTLQTTHAWLGELERELDLDRQTAWKVLSTVLHKLRDRLPLISAAHLASQLPLLIRGAYYDQYQPASQPRDWDTVEEFLAEVAKWLSDARPVDPAAATAAVFALLSRQIASGQIVKLQDVLPEALRNFWLDAETGMLAPE